MCTVSFYSNPNYIVLTSNRDENQNRPLAEAPKCELINGMKLYFPKDPQAHGSWFVVNQYGETFVLLNGAKKKHISNPPYQKSRGLVLLELASSPNLVQTWKLCNLIHIEPFTVVAFVASNLFQLRWNGIEKELVNLDASKPKIWSSATLYEPEIIKQRETWFADFLENQTAAVTPEALFHFHTQTQNQDSENGLLIARNNNMLTKNVTQCIIKPKKFELIHLDLITKTKNILSENI